MVYVDYYIQTIVTLKMYQKYMFSFKNYVVVFEKVVSFLVSDLHTYNTINLTPITTIYDG